MALIEFRILSDEIWSRDFKLAGNTGLTKATGMGRGLQPIFGIFYLQKFRPEIIANRGGPRCCKRDSFLASMEAVEFMKEHFKINLPIKEKIVGSFSHLNTECLHEDCRFFQQ
jgi:hypothetical protein